MIQDNLQLDIEVQGDLLLAIVRGAASFDAALGAAKQVLDAAAKHQVSRILVDTLAVEGVLTTMERYELALEAVARADQGKMNPRLRLWEHLQPRTDSVCALLKIAGSPLNCSPRGNMRYVGLKRGENQPAADGRGPLLADTAAKGGCNHYT